jgi:pimeloyl-ACP methyl ester carboxylesterase
MALAAPRDRDGRPKVSSARSVIRMPGTTWGATCHQPAAVDTRWRHRLPDANDLAGSEEGRASVVSALRVCPRVNAPDGDRGRSLLTPLSCRGPELGLGAHRQGYRQRVGGRQRTPRDSHSPSEALLPGRGLNGPTLWTADGVGLATRCWIPDAPAVATVVICHGLTGNKDHPRVVALADRLYDNGYRVVTYDARGHGSSGGICTLGKLEGLDVAAVAEWADTLGSQVVLVGASLGAVAALAYAANSHVATGVVAISSPGDWRLPFHVRSLVTAGLARTRAGRRWANRKMNVRIGPWAAPESARNLLQAVRCPVVVMHGSADPIIPSNFSLAHGLREGPLRELVVVPGMGHAFDPIGLTPILDATSRLINRGLELADS